MVRRQSVPWKRALTTFCARRSTHHRCRKKARCTAGIMPPLLHFCSAGVGLSHPRDGGKGCSSKVLPTSDHLMSQSVESDHQKMPPTWAVSTFPLFPVLDFLCYLHHFLFFRFTFLYLDSQPLSLLEFCCCVWFNHVPRKRDNY